MSLDQIHSIADTAIMAAAYRAQESTRNDALFSDPLAAVLSGHRGKQIIESLPPKAFLGGWTVVIRTCIIDHLITDAVATGTDTIINLGAGLDTRPYRMKLPPNLKWIEADTGPMIEFKNKALAEHSPGIHLERVPLDLTHDSDRKNFLSSATRSSRQTLILCEAVLPYLNEQVVAALAKDLHQTPTVQSWICDYFSPAAYQYRRKSGMSAALKNAPFLFEPPDYFGFFKNLKWSPKQVRYLPEVAKQLRRPPPFPLAMKLATALARFIASQEQKEKMNRYAGFVLFEKLG